MTTPQIQYLEKLARRVVAVSYPDVAFEDTGPARMLRELQKLVNALEDSRDRLMAQRDARTLQLAEALGEVAETDEGERSPAASWEELVEAAKDYADAFDAYQRGD